MIEVTDDWSSVDWARRPAAPAVGPFPHREFLETWWEHRGEGELWLVESETTLLPLRGVAGTIEFVGEADLTDYHSPLGSDGGAVAAAFLGTRPAGTRFAFDSLPAEVARPLKEGLEAAGYSVAVRVHEVSAVLSLPSTDEDRLGALGSKQRHEARRKTRRFAEAYGTARLTRTTERDALAPFTEMHRAAAGPKGSFMTPALERFFGALLGIPGAVIHFLTGDESIPLAASFGFETPDAYYLYNSAFDPAARALSPGAVLLELLLSESVGAGRGVFDFLKGDEAYKFRMGADPRELYVVEGTT